jgi:hypothetical protein
MRTTLDLDDRLIAAAKQRAAEAKTSLTRFIEDALRNYLAPPRNRGTFELEPVIKRGKPRPGLDIADREALYARMAGK